VWAAAGLASAPLGAAGPDDPAAGIRQELERFQNLGSVLYVAAHPDDENTQLITYLARGRNYRTAYLSLTRGDGGQNVLGPEFGDLLGVVRTQELLAARRVDGGRQFFSRARDFGYSKDYRQTLTKWDRGQVLADIVRVIREFRPDVVVTRFSPDPGPTHGHHTASAALALEAFGLAGDPKALPGQLAGLEPWAPRRILWNGYFPGRTDVPAGTLRLQIDGTDPTTGASFAALAARSRSMHRTQGFANFSVASAGSGPHVESFRLLAGEPAKGDLMDGVDTSWGRIAGGGAIGAEARAIEDGLAGRGPAGSVPALLALRARLAAVPDGMLVLEKRAELDRILADCLGLGVTTRSAQEEIVPGETVTLVHSVRVASAVPVRWVSVRYPSMGRDLVVGVDLAGGNSSRSASRELPRSALLSQPYWLKGEETAGMFRVDDASMIGRPESPAPIPVDYVFEVGGQELVIRDEALYDPGAGELPHPPFVIPPVSLAFGTGVALLAPGSSREVTVEVTSARPGVSGTLSLDVPAGWRASPAGRNFRIGGSGEKAALSFTLEAPMATGAGAVLARASVGGAVYSSGRRTISYRHIPRQILQSQARLRVASLELSVRGGNVAYLPGAGDDTPESLRAMGCRVTEISGEDLESGRLASFDAVVIGIRAFNTRTDLAARLPALFKYVEDGGTVVDQYNTPGNLQTQELAPYTLKLSRDLPRFRVTDERSAVALLVPESPVFNSPNRIGAADFSGWVQERGLDFASEWDAAHFTPLLSCSDPGEPPLEGGLLVARHGRGYFVYTGLSFFRQLPAGVPGAYRLFANLISLGK
jgi:LmbE family N-acetylglucosaminyl deacetylase